MDNSVTLFASACVEDPANETVVAFEVAAAPVSAPAPAPASEPEAYHQQQQQQHPQQDLMNLQAMQQQLQQ